MHVESLEAVGFRNLEGIIPFSNPLTIIVGENNASKSGVIDALRLLFEPTSGPKAKRWLTPADFAHDGKGTRIQNELRLSVVLGGLSDEERGRMTTCLAPGLGDDKAVLTLQAELLPSGRVDVQWLGGDKRMNTIEKWARLAVTQTYMHPLRDAVSDLRPGRDNKLVTVVNSLAPVDHPDRAKVESIAKRANDLLAEVAAISGARQRVQQELDALTGPSQFTQMSEVGFARPEFDRIVTALQALAGHNHPLELEENGLGYNNLFYMATLLAAFSDAKESVLNLLLIEEPEAHLHPQLQDLVISSLESGSASTQVILTSHSPQLASAAQVERITLLARANSTTKSLAYTPRSAGLTEKESKHLRRFLDVTKASLFFARGVLLVEGIAEQLMIPALARHLDLELAHHGISVINVGGLAFGPFAALFQTGGLPFRCAVLSDSDPTAERPVSPAAETLLGLASKNLKVELSRRTFEWDLADEDDRNWVPLVDAVKRVKSTVGANLAANIPNAKSARADALLAAIEDKKGRFAQELADVVDALPPGAFHVPPYIARAIFWVCGQENKIK